MEEVKVKIDSSSSTTIMHLGSSGDTATSLLSLAPAQGDVGERTIPSMYGPPELDYVDKTQMPPA
jgi:hypothetical protein